jgi:hypothetical protein
LGVTEQAKIRRAEYAAHGSRPGCQGDGARAAGFDAQEYRMRGWTLRHGAHHFDLGLRWQAQRDTALK